MSIENEQFLKVKEVAAYLRIGNMTVYQLIHSGQLEYVKVGRTYRVYLWSANQWLKKNSSTNREETN